MSEFGILTLCTVLFLNSSLRRRQDAFVHAPGVVFEVSPCSKPLRAVLTETVSLLCVFLCAR